MNYRQVPLLLNILFVLYGVLNCNSAPTTSSKNRKKQGERNSGVDDPQRRDEISEEYFSDTKPEGPQLPGAMLDAYADDTMKGFPFEAEEEGLGDDEVVYLVKGSQDSANDSVNGLLITKEFIVSMPPPSDSPQVCLNEHCQAAEVHKKKPDYVILSIKNQRHDVQSFATLKEGEKQECLANYEALMVDIVREQNTVKCKPECIDGMVLTCDHKPAGLVRVKDDVNRFYSAEELFVVTLQRDVPGAPMEPKRVENKPAESTDTKVRSSKDGAGAITVPMMAIGFLTAVSLLIC